MYIHVFTEKRILELFNAWEAEGKDNEAVFIDTISKEFGWTTRQAYWATDFLFRPENTN